MKPRRLLLYAHFDPEDVVRDYVVHALRAMRPSCSSIRFATTSRLPEPERQKLASYVDECRELENVGFDFFMWKRTLEPGDVETYDEIVLMNSSVYGPFCDPSSMFDAMAQEPCDAWGITENLEFDWHVQSYFMVFRKPILESDAFGAFWGSVLPHRSKRQVIRSYELGLSQWLRDNGFTVRALCPWNRVVTYLESNRHRAFVFDRNLPRALWLAVRTAAFLRRWLPWFPIATVNPTIAFPEELLELGVPFLKLEVMRDNPFGRDVEAIRWKLKSLGYPTDHLLPPRRTGRSRGE